MTRFKVAASVAFALLAGSAMAADLPSRKAAPVYVPPAPTFTWTGLYGGINIGYGFGNGDQDVGGTSYVSPGAAVGAPPPLGTAWSLQNNIQGVLGGGQVGYNYQFNPWLVVGFETDIQAADLHSQSTGGGAAGTSAGGWFPHFSLVNQTKSVDWFGTVRGRLGVTFPNIPTLLVFGTGGLAYGQVVHTFGVGEFYAPPGAGVTGAIIGSGSDYDGTKVGWTAGGGLEWSPGGAWSAWSVKVEYLYTDLGSTTVGGGGIISFPAGGPVFAYTHTSETRFHTVRAGLNWHFNPFTPAPVVAKY